MRDMLLASVWLCATRCAGLRANAGPRSNAARRTAAQAAPGASEAPGRPVDVPGTMPVDEGAISAHEFARSFSAPLLTAPPSAPTAPPSGAAAQPSSKPTLSPLQQDVLLRGGTEPPGHSEAEGGLDYGLVAEGGTKYPQKGAFLCAQCTAPLYWARSKFGSGSGWPAFYSSVEGAVVEKEPVRRDPLSTTLDVGNYGIELSCRNCGGHLGHVFRGEAFGTPTDARHCVNGVCLKYDGAAVGHPEELRRVNHLTLGGIPP
ncbi:Mss4-like protein [Pelagophyceae sp. CCMP2097]|nr:Mss4-like protein [Pelagophyceae sp. CCMP2097]